MQIIVGAMWNGRNGWLGFSSDYRADLREQFWLNFQDVYRQMLNLCVLLTINQRYIIVHEFSLCSTQREDDRIGIDTMNDSAISHWNFE